MEQFIEQILQFMAAHANSLVSMLPVSFAFAAGMMATVNPCGFALLPAYISLYLGGSTDQQSATSSAFSRILKALLISFTVTIAFVLMFGGVGLIISAGGRFLANVLPVAAFAIGIAMVILGISILTGKNYFQLALASTLSSRIKTKESGGLASFFLFGIAYAIASLSCTLPIFLAVAGSSLATGGFFSGLVQFLSYALGMGAVITILTIGTALFRGAVARYVRKFLPYVEKASAVLIIIAGTFVIYYWLTIGGLARNIRYFF